MNRTIRINLWRSLTLLLLVSLVLPWTAFAAVWTDKLDYSPGEVVTILGDNSDGAGYIPGETVHVDVVGPNGYTAMCDGVAADDSNAAWSCQVILWDSDLAVGTYTYTATGLTSGVEEEGTFTDANPSVASYLGTCEEPAETNTFVPYQTVCAKATGLGPYTTATIEFWSPHSDSNDPPTHFKTYEPTSGSEELKLSLDDTYAELGPWTIKLYADGKERVTHTFNVIPAVTINTGDYEVFDISSPVSVQYSWTDPPDPPENPDSFTCTVDWGDGTEVNPLDCTPEPPEPEDPPSLFSTWTSAHDYTSAGAGLYPITVTVEDDHGGIGTASITVVVYDADGGFVSGGGWFYSGQGAYEDNGQDDADIMAGLATFGFVSKYHKGATAPEGETEFQFHTADLSFNSDSYEWLVVNKPVDGVPTNAQYQGKGTIEGRSGAFNFMLWAADGETLDGPDNFRIKIWPDDTVVGGDQIYYDNCAGAGNGNPVDIEECIQGYGQPIEDGNIIIHTDQKNR